MAMDEQSAIKDKAEAYFAKGKLKEAGETYEQIRQSSGKDPRIAIRLGDIYRKMEKKKEAIDAYKLAANAFIKQGFITKAIAVCKIILDIDPSQTDVQKRIADLYTKKGFGPAEEKKAETPKPAPIKEEAPSREEVEQPPVQVPRTPLFSDLTKDELIEVIGKVKNQIVSPGVYIFKEGDKGDSSYIVVSGTVDIIGKDKKREEVILSTLTEGDFFGEFGFFSNARREASVRASSPANVLEIVKDDMEDIIKKFKRVALVLFDFYKERVVDRLMALSPIFKPLTPDDRRAILATLSSKRFEAGTTVVKEGETGDTMYLIKEGQVKVWLDDPQKGKVVLNVLEEGDFFGEIALATSRPRVANVTAVTNAELVIFSRGQIKDVVEKYPEIKKVLEDIIKERVTTVVQAKELPTAALV